MHENMKTIFNSWQMYSDDKEWTIKEDNDSIVISSFHQKSGTKVFSARLTRSENPSDSSDATYTLHYWGQSWNAIFACTEDQLTRNFTTGGMQVKSLINLAFYEIHQYSKQDFTLFSNEFRRAALAYKNDKTRINGSGWLCSDEFPDLSMLSMKDLRHGNDSMFTRLLRKLFK